MRTIVKNSNVCVRACEPTRACLEVERLHGVGARAAEEAQELVRAKHALEMRVLTLEESAKAVMSLGGWLRAKKRRKSDDSTSARSPRKRGTGRPGRTRTQ